MEWYWWVLIAIGVIAIASVKLKVFGMILERRKRRELEQAEAQEE